MGKNLRETLAERMKDPEFRTEWEATEAERQAMWAEAEGRNGKEQQAQPQCRETAAEIPDRQQPAKGLAQKRSSN